LVGKYWQANQITWHKVIRILPTFDLMTKKDTLEYKSPLAKLLLISALFVSLFTFSGTFGQSSQQRQKAQTELVYYAKVKAAYSTAGRKQHVVRPGIVALGARKSNRNSIFACGRLSKVKFDELSRQPVMNRSRYQVHHVKTIPQSSDEDSAWFLVG